MSAQKPDSKILIMGLENSGKTSIILSLKRDVNLLSYYSLKPTKGYSIEEVKDLDKLFHIWDFGGQAQYRVLHLKNMKNYIEATKKLLYVVDVQDKQKYDASMEYFSDILKIFKEEQIFPELSVFLHKYDPNLEMDEKDLTEITNKVKKTVPTEFTHMLFKTTIFTVFRKDLMS